MSAPQPDTESQPLRVLLVEDSPPDVRLLQEMLAASTTELFQITHVECLMEALHQLVTERFDVVLIDQTMPHLTGEALTYELRRVRPDVPVILCTDFSHSLTEETARALGIDALLMKPLVACDLALTIRQVLAARQAQVG